MNPERFQQIDRLLDEALDREPGQRQAFLEQACAGDEQLFREVSALLAAHEQAGSFVERPALDLAAQALARRQGQSLVGRRLGPYEILSLLGKGGMGEVYRVRDTRLDRVEAFKILPVDVATDPQRLHRFVREAKAASALNHPNIATIYEIGESEGIHWIAMELVEGQTLAERLAGTDQAALAPARGRGSRGEGLDLDTFLDIGIQTAEGLEAAHKKGIIHRDIKPSNLMMTEEGRVKILDFGLAKVEREGKAGAVEITETYTIPGLIMGTAPYMSPEQVLGQPVDPRTDIFSLGVVLYEMATGKPPFAGETASAIFDAIVRQPIAWPLRVQAGIPEELRRIIQKTLEKFREMRYQSAAQLGTDLKHLRKEMERERSLAQPTTAASSGRSDHTIVPSKKKRRFAVGGMLGLIVVGAFIIWLLKSRLSSVPETTLSPIPLTSYPGSEQGVSFSPDGSQVAFAWDGEKGDNWDIYVKLIGSDQNLRLTTNPAEDTWPAWSPDGQQIAFCRRDADRELVVLISPLGGPERILTETGGGDLGPNLSWSPDGRALAIVDDTKESKTCLALYWIETGERHILTKDINPNTRYLVDTFPAFSPNGHVLAFYRNVNWGNGDLYLLDLLPDLKPAGEPRRITHQDESISGVAWSSDGSELIYSAGGSLWSIAASGSSHPQKLASLGQGNFYPAISHRASRLACTHRTTDINIWRVEISSPGRKANPPEKFIASTRIDAMPQYSPDGRKITFGSDRSGSYEIWICDADGSNAIQLTHIGGGAPQWSPDSRQLTFISSVEGHVEVFVINASGGNPRRLTFSSGSENPFWSKDGRWIYFNYVGGDTQKICAEGGPVIPVGPGWYPIESVDGRFVYTIGERNDRHWFLNRLPVEGGVIEKVALPPNSGVTHVVAVDGIYFLSGADIKFLELATGNVKTIAELGKRLSSGLTISPDRHWALCTQTDYASSDLMLVENFR